MRRPPRAPTLARLILAAGVLAASPALATEPLSGLLGSLAPPEPPRGQVDVVGWVERNGGRSELVVTFVPKGQVKLVADPGVTVTPVPRAGIAWTQGEPVSLVEAGHDYFAQPPVVRVPFAGQDGQPVAARVDYAYCLVDYQCLFGQATVSASTEAPRG